MLLKDLIEIHDKFYKNGEIIRLSSSDLRMLIMTEFGVSEHSYKKIIEPMIAASLIQGNNFKYPLKSTIFTSLRFGKDEAPKPSEPIQRQLTAEEEVANVFGGTSDGE